MLYFFAKIFLFNIIIVIFIKIQNEYFYCIQNLIKKLKNILKIIKKNQYKQILKLFWVKKDKI